MTTVRNATRKNVYFTEQYTAPTSNFSDLSWHMKNVIIGYTKNWSRIVMEWNLASDNNQRPHTPGASSLSKGPLTIQGSSITPNFSYYIIAYASKFLNPGAVRIGSNNSEYISSAAFKDPDGSKVLIAYNNSSLATSCNVK